MNNSPSTDDQKHWIWGIFYYNKDDDRIFPPKRIPWMGWTVNFAKTKSILAFLAMMAFFIFIIFMIGSRK